MNLTFIPIENANANAAICTPCGGKCCQQMPGTVFPADLDPELTMDGIKRKAREMLQSGRYAIDWWEGSPFEDKHRKYECGYYLRPAVKGMEGVWTDATWGGACTFHGATGCELSETRRPTECRALVPVAPGLCYQPEGWEGRRTGAKAWWPYRFILGELREEYQESLYD